MTQRWPSPSHLRAISEPSQSRLRAISEPSQLGRANSPTALEQPNVSVGWDTLGTVPRQCWLGYTGYSAPSVLAGIHWIQCPVSVGWDTLGTVPRQCWLGYTGYSVPSVLAGIHWVQCPVSVGWDTHEYSAPSVLAWIITSQQLYLSPTSISVHQYYPT